jgi:hypothetical protein
LDEADEIIFNVLIVVYVVIELFAHVVASFVFIADLERKWT